MTKIEFIPNEKLRGLRNYKFRDRPEGQYWHEDKDLLLIVEVRVLSFMVQQNSKL